MLWNAAGNIVYLGCQWLITYLVAILASDFSDAGVLSLAMSISATFQSLALFGIRNYQVSDLESKHSDNAYVQFRGITCLATLVLCMGFSAVGQYSSRQLLAILWFMLFRLAEDYSDVLHGIAQKNDRLDLAGKSFVIKGVGSIVVFLLGYRIFHSLNAGLFLMMLFSWISTAFFDWILIRKLADFSLFGERMKNCWELGRKTLPLCIYMFLLSALSTVPKLFLEAKLGNEILGAYSSIFAPALLIAAAAGYLFNPFAPMFAKLYQDREKKNFLGLFGKISTAITILFALVLIVAFFAGDFGLRLLFGEKILPYTGYLMPILFAIYLNAMLQFLCLLSVVLRDFLWLLLSCGIGLLAEVLFSAPLLNRFGANGASYGWIVASLLSVAILSTRTFTKLFINQKETTI